MKNVFSKLFGLFFFSFLSWQPATAQYQSDHVNSLINEYDYQRDSDSIGVGMSLDLSQTLANYYRSTYLYIHDELQDQLDQLIGIGPLPESSVNDQGRQILQEHIAAEGRIAAKMVELDLVSKAAKVPGRNMSSPLYLLTDWQLRSYHHQLLRSFALNEGFEREDAEPFNLLYNNVLGGIEKELRKRGLFLNSTKTALNWQALMQERFDCVEELNRAAIQEALHLVDKNFALILEERVRLVTLTERIGKIDEQLGVEPGKLSQTGELLTDETKGSRIGILEHGKKIIQEKHCATRQYSPEILLHLAMIDEHLAQEKKWLYLQKNHQVIERGYTNRGPPGDIPPVEFEEPPFPKEPSPGDLTLARFLNEAKAASIEQEKEKAFEKIVSRQWERFKAFNLDMPQWQSNVFTSKFTRSASYNTPESYLRFLALRHFETLPFDLGKAGLYKAEFDVALKWLYHGESRSIFSFLENDPTKLFEFESNLGFAHKNINKKIEARGAFATSDMYFEEKQLSDALNQIKAARQNMTLRPRIGKGQWVNRPPPSWTVLPESIHNEAYYKEVLISQKQSLERTKAGCGIHVPASVDIQLKAINQTLILNEMAISLGEYQKFNNDASDMKILERFSEFYTHLKPGLEEMKTKQAALFTRFNQAFGHLITLNTISVPTKLFEIARNVHKSFAGHKKVVKGAGIWRPNQDLETIKSMNLSKDYGGIWLSPKKFEIQPVTSIDFPWKSIASNEYCPDKDYFEWVIDPEAVDIEIICFPKTEMPLNTQHWLNQIKPW